jgi:hypothetical protein
MAKTPSVEVKHLPQLRNNTHLLLLQNPNYFGNISDPAIANKYKPVIILDTYRTWYEQLECIGYTPATQTLGAVVNIKQPSGYNGSPCYGGSREYVRFFLDYNHNGTWVDCGITNFGIYDHNFTDTLSYYADLTLDPAQLACCHDTAVLPRVRAILSWNTPPPANTPGYQPTWGNVLESDIQLAPNNHILCYLSGALKEQTQLKVNPELLNPEFLTKTLPALSDLSLDVQKPSPTPAALKQSYGNAVPDARIALHAVSTYLNAPNPAASPDFLQAMLKDFNFANIFPVYENPQVDTAWEELGCVGLDRNSSQLNATVVIKQNVGYNGGLCTTGSNEYVAFYMDFGGGWVYMGTSSVAVHDIPRNNPDPLAYDVSLTVNLDPYRQAWCSVGKAKVLAILSWSVPPTPNDPNYQPFFGDSEEATVEVQPLPAGVVPGETTPSIEMIGGMAITDINQTTGKATITAHSSSYLDGNESPFYGRLLITGHIFNPPPGTRYRLNIQTASTNSLNPLLDKQYVQTDTLGAISTPQTLTPDPDGWMPYLAIGSNVSIVDNLLGIYYTPSGNDGLYWVSVDLLLPSNTIIFGTAVAFLVNSEFPIVAIDITTGGGNCSSFGIPNPVSGTFSMTNTNFANDLSISVTPNNGAVVSILPGAISGLTYAAGTLSTFGDTGNFSIDTSQMTVCGYNVRIDAHDRTLLNSDQFGYPVSNLQGFCLINS